MRMYYRIFEVDTDNGKRYIIKRKIFCFWFNVIIPDKQFEFPVNYLFGDLTFDTEEDAMKALEKRFPRPEYHRKQTKHD